VTEPDTSGKSSGGEAPYYIPVEEIMSSPVIGIDAADLYRSGRSDGTARDTSFAVFKDDAIVGICRCATCCTRFQSMSFKRS
jgi:hypothetical protein